MIDTGKCFGKKRDLSTNNLNHSNAPRKLREECHQSETFVASLCNSGVFSGPFENSDCKDILIKVLKKLDIQVKQIFQLSQKKKESQIKGQWPTG